jgi:hypothetical protein
MIWLKRTIPFVLLIALWFGYRSIQQSNQRKVLSQTQRAASVTARLWFASAKYRTEPERYTAFRDSLLKANDWTRESLSAFVSKYDADPDWAELYSSTIRNKIDSLFKIEDSVRKANVKTAVKQPADTVKILSKIPQPSKVPDSLTRPGRRLENAPVRR